MRNCALTLTLTLGAGVPLELYEAFWFASLRDTEAYRAAFEALYHLEIGTMMDGGVPIDAMVPVDGFTIWWLEIGLFLLTPDAACLSGCQQSQRPVM